MIFRLALKNVKKSMWDYAVYFVTLVIGISVFYVFHAITEQTVYKQLLPGGERLVVGIGTVSNVVAVIGVIVSVVLACLVVYGNNFLIKCRMKEFSIYMLLGMKKQRLAGILVVETAVVGAISLVFGVLLGIALSQGMSVFVIKLFETDMSKFSFTVSWAAVRKTLLYFSIMYAAVLVLDLFTVAKVRLIYLLNAKHTLEWRTIRNPKICAAVFVLAAGLLGHVYYMATVKLSELYTLERISVELVELVVATILIFWSIAGMLLFLAQSNKRFYLRGLHAFTVREMSGRINTNVIAGAVVSFLMFMAIVIFSVCISISFELNQSLRKWIPVDVSFEYSYYGVPEHTLAEDERLVEDLFRQKEMEGLFQDPVEVTVYQYQEPEIEDIDSYEVNVFANGGLEMIGINDYNRLAERYGMNTHTLAEDEYFVISNRRYQMNYYGKQYLAKGSIIRLCGKEYRPKYGECQEGFLRMNYFPDTYGITVVPQDALSDERIQKSYNLFVADYNAANEADARRIDEYVKSDAFYNELFPGEGKYGGLFGTYKSELYSESVGVMSLLVFVGLYLGMIFFITSSALFSLKELSQAVDSQEKYKILRKLGVDNKTLRWSLFWQNFTFFGVPLLFALMHSLFGIRALYELIISATDIFEGTAIKQSLVVTVSLMASIYLIYFCITYRFSRRIVERDE